MKKKIYISLISIITIICIYIILNNIFYSEKQKKQNDIEYWTCGMHPSVKRSGPGKCPICSMDLIPVKIKSKTNHRHKGSELHKERLILKNEIRLDARSRLLAQVQTTKVEYKNLSKNILTIGKVDYNEKRLKHVASWIPGRIDKLYIDYTGSYVKKGQALLNIYSPKLISTQQEYITLLKNKKLNQNNTTHNQFILSVKRRLVLLGMTKNQIKKLEKTHTVSTHTTIYSPISGTVIKKYVHEGMYFKEGQVLYDIADLSQVWVYADIYEYEISKIRTGLRVLINVPSYNVPIYGTITFIDPVINPQTRTVKVRASLLNRNLKLKPNMFVNVIIKIPLGRKTLAIPRTAVLDTGIRQVVYVEKKPGIYIMRNVKLDPLSGNFYPIKHGLKYGEYVVTKGTFLIDSQSQLTGGSSLLYGGADEIKKDQKPKHKGHHH